MKILVISDIHQKFECVVSARKKFEEGNYDKIVFLGDYFDSFDRDMLDAQETLRLILEFKNDYKERCILLLGNHDMFYMYDNPYYRCSGNNNILKAIIQPTLIEHENKFSMSYTIKGDKGIHFFSHAGICQPWFKKYKDKISQILIDKGITALNIDTLEHLPTIFEVVRYTKDQEILCEVGVRRGGIRGDYGGLTWCDETEIMNYNPLIGLHQYVGHTPQKYIRKETKFQGSYYDNTSVTFCDVLNTNEELFLTLEI